MRWARSLLSLTNKQNRLEMSRKENVFMSIFLTKQKNTKMYAFVFLSFNELRPAYLLTVKHTSLQLSLLFFSPVPVCVSSSPGSWSWSGQVLITPLLYPLSSN